MNSTIKSFSVGKGDMFYINHASDSFTVIDCCLTDETGEENLDEICDLSNRKGIARFISTHPDEDHIHGIEHLNSGILCNFYCVQNDTEKEDESDSFKKYRDLRDDKEKAFYISTGCSRQWLNSDSEERGSAGINILWPDCDNECFKDALDEAAAGGSPNNISPIIRYSLTDGVKALWMGDLETEFMEAIEDDVDLSRADILFAPHHGRKSGRVPESMLKIIDPKIIVIGEAPSEHLNYYQNYNTITQNSAGDIVFDCHEGKVHIFTSKNYSVDFLTSECRGWHELHYLGTLNL